jgi:hypothetical protein
MTEAWERVEKRHRQQLLDAVEEEGGAQSNSEGNPINDGPSELTNVLGELANNSRNRLFNPAPLTSNQSPPSFRILQLSPIKHYSHLLDQEPQTEREKMMQKIIAEQQLHEAFLKGQLRGQQASLVLQNVYVRKARSQLAYSEGRITKKRSTTAIKVKEANKIGRLLTSNEMTGLYSDHRKEIEQARQEAEERKEVTRRYHKAKAQWEAGEAERKKKCEQINTQWKAEVSKWEIEKERAKKERKRPGWLKPKRPQLPKALPKPQKADFAAKDGENASSDDDNDDEGSDGTNESDGDSD